MRRSEGSRIGRVLVAITAIVAVAIAIRDPAPEGNDASRRLGAEDRRFTTDDPLERGCGVDPVLLTRLWRGSDGEPRTWLHTKPRWTRERWRWSSKLRTRPWGDW